MYCCNSAFSYENCQNGWNYQNLYYYVWIVDHKIFVYFRSLDINFCFILSMLSSSWTVCFSRVLCIFLAPPISQYLLHLHTYCPCQLKFELLLWRDWGRLCWCGPHTTRLQKRIMNATLFVHFQSYANISVLFYPIGLIFC